MHPDERRIRQHSPAFSSTWAVWACLVTRLPGDVYFGKTTGRLGHHEYHYLELAEEVRFIDRKVPNAMMTVLLQPDDPSSAEELR